MANGEISGPPAVDFYGMLSGLGNTIHKGMLERAAQQKEQAGLAAFSQLDPNSPNYMAAAQAAFQSGNMEAGQKLLALKIADDERKHTYAREGVTDSHWNQDYALRKAAAARADDPTPDNFVADKSVPGGYRPIGPADPAYIENVAAAKARAASLVPPDGFVKQPDGSVVPLPGGPQDPVYIGASESAKAKAKAAAGGDNPEYGLNPIYGVGPDGKPAVVQLSKNGKAYQPQLPDGFQISKDPIKVDAGTHFVLLDPQTRQQIGVIPKDLAGAEQAKVIGEETGKAQIALPQVLSTANQTLQSIEGVRKHPGRYWGTGSFGTIPGIPGTDQRGFVAALDQLKGKTFLEAFNSLRGGGAITEAEGAKATNALARLDRAQNDKDFEAGLNDLRDVVKAGMLRAAAKARGSSAAPVASAADPLGIR